MPLTFVEKLLGSGQLRGVSIIVDLKSVYLLIHIAKKSWRYQLVKYNRKIYCLTKVGFQVELRPKNHDEGTQGSAGKERRHEGWHKFIH